MSDIFRNEQMKIERPDLSTLPEEVRTYIEFLEKQLHELKDDGSKTTNTLEPLNDEQEAPSTKNLITLSKNGWIKRTPRYLYNRQRRGGMGVFDINLASTDQPTLITIADDNERLLLLTNLARAYHIPVSRLNQVPIHHRGEEINSIIQLENHEHITAVLPNPSTGYILAVSKNGYIRRLRNHIFGEYMKPGTQLMNIQQSGELVTASQSSGDGDVLISTRNGVAIRFSEKVIPPQGCLGIRLREGDLPISVCGVKNSSGVFFIGADGNGTIRLMSGFSQNKAPGSGGKIAIKTDHLVASTAINETDDIFVISRLGKIIRFLAVEVPPKEGVVQGVLCMSLRADECVNVVASR